MLRLLRNKKTSKKIWIGLAIIIIPAFTLWGFIGTKGDRTNSPVAGRIFGRNVSDLEFRDALIAVRTMALMRFGDKLPEIEKYLDLQSQAWERLILLYEAKRRKIKVKDKEVVETIQKMPYFQDKNGFSNKIYQEILRYVLRLQPRIFEELTRQNLIITKLHDQVTENVKLSDEQIHQEYLKANEELSIDYIASQPAEFAKDIKPTDKEVMDYFDRNRAMFKEPPANGAPVRIPEFSEIKDKVKEALINETAQKIAQDKINECAQKLKQLQFKQAAAACGLKSSSTDFFKSAGVVENLGPAASFWETARKLKAQEYSSVISNSQGYYIIKLKTLKPADENKFRQEKEAFSKRLESSKKNERFIEFLDELKKKAQ